MKFLPAFLLILFFNNLTFPDTLTLKSPRELFPFCRDHSFIKINHQGFYYSLITYYDKYSENKSFACISSDKFKNYTVEDETLIDCNECKDFQQELVRINIPVIEMKLNVIPFLNTEFFIKILYILNKINFTMKISDAMRTEENQLKYKRRGWSDKEISPHLTGLAVDLGSFFSRDMRDKIRSISEQLGIKFLEHGRRGNRHIHLQDERKWSRIKGKNIYDISNDIMNRIFATKNSRKIFSDLSDTAIRTTDIKIELNPKRSSIYKFRIENILDIKSAEITTGLYPEGYYKIGLAFDYLKKGFYKIWIFENDKCIGEKYFFKY
jgi:hypothetical protein